MFVYKRYAGEIRVLRWKGYSFTYTEVKKMKEINELYTEELKLLKRIQSYGKEQRQGKLERIDKVTLLLLYRI